ncbi:MAG TPA: DNA topoisomerase VI subunit B [Candidatus Acidoferrales bacterium]|nr:DNA topoisomerase VI subunit B [Candidatus Acidoferrales bacterium]
MEVKRAEEIFKEFKEHSVSEFFKKNRQMLGYSGKIRSLVTLVHEYVTNSLDACEEAGILPDITVELKNIGEEKYSIMVADNGPGIPKTYIGKALATVLAGTKFNRYMQQRGQQGIGAAGCTMFSQMTTGKPIKASSCTGTGKAYSCEISIDTVKNKPVVNNLVDIEEKFQGLRVYGEFADVKYENSDHGVFEYLRRTALSNPHMQLKFIDPEGKESTFVRAVETVPERPKPAKPHPLGLAINDLLDFAHTSESRKISSFMVEFFSRVTPNKVAELKEFAKDVDFEKDPKKMSWDDADKMIKAFKQVKWIAPDAISIMPIGEEQVKVAVRNILNPEFMVVIERKAKVFRGGIPFIVEAAVAFGGQAGRKTETGYEGSILRFANRVPLLFDSGSCAITVAVKDIQWRRYKIDMDTQPVSVLVNISSVHIPYSGVGKESVAQEEEIIEEIKLAVMDAARGVQRYVSGKMALNSETNRYKMIMRYTKQLSMDLSGLTGKDEKKILDKVTALVSKHYPNVKMNGKGEPMDEVTEITALQPVQSEEEDTEEKEEE